MALFTSATLSLISSAPALGEPPPQQDAARNLIAGDNFENGMAPWWGSGNAVKGVGPQGAAALKLSSGYACHDKIAVPGGSRCRISMAVKSDGAPVGSVYAQVSFRGGDLAPAWYGPAVIHLNWGTEPALFVTGGTQDWSTFSAVVIVPDGGDQVLIYLRKQDGTGGDAMFSRVSVELTADPATTAAEVERQGLASKLLPPPLDPATAAAGIQMAMAAAAGSSPKQLTLASNGVMRYHVHVGTNAEAIVLHSADELSTTLAKISGAPSPTFSYDGHPAAGPLIVIGRDSVLAKGLCPTIAFEQLGPDGFVIRTVGPHLVIAGNTPGGTMYGVDWFLDHKLGVKWLSPDFTYIPTEATIRIDPVTTEEIPRFGFRQVLSAEGQDKAFAAHNLLNGNSHGAYGILSPATIDHWDGSWQRPGLTASFYDLLPPDKFQKAHPDWYAGGQVAMMNPGLRQSMADAIVARLKSVSDRSSFWFGFMDNDWDWRMDPASAAFAHAHGDAPSGPRLDMAIDVANRVREVLPDARIAFNAYHWSFSPPTGMSVPDSLLVYPMTIHLDYSTPLNVGRNEKLGKDIAGWNAISNNILLWDHITNFSGFIQPTPNIYPICKTIRWLSTMPHIHGYFAEGSWNTRGAEFASLRAWIMARMLWNPQTDYETALAGYCDRFYGAAGKIVKAYIDLAHSASAAAHAPIWEKTNVDSPLFTLEFVKEADALFDRAEVAVAHDTVSLKHVRQARLPVDYVILLRRQEYMDEAAQHHVTFGVDLDRRLARFNQTVKDEGITQYRQDGSMAELAGVMAINRRASIPPSLVLRLPRTDWKEIQDLGINRYYSTTIVVPDDQASDGAAVRVNGSDGGAWVVQLKHHCLPEEGQWNLYAEVRIEADNMQSNETAFTIGTQAHSLSVPLHDLSDGRYHLIQAPGGPVHYSTGDQDITYIAPPGSRNVHHIYVDRFVAVRVP